MNKREQKEAGLISMIWPIIVELIITGLIANVNLVILNSFSSNAVAVIGSGSQIIVVIINIYGIVSIGTSIILAHTVGAKHYDDCNQLISTALFVNFIFGICLSLVGVIFIPSMLKFINMPEELVGMAKQYLLVCIGFSFLQALLMTLNAIFRSLGEMKKVLITMVSVNLLCLILNKLVSVYIPRDSQNLMQYTFTGMISQLVGIVMFIIMLYQNKTINYKFSIKDISYNASRYLIKILRYGIPGGLEGIIFLISQTIVVTCGIEAVYLLGDFGVKLIEDGKKAVLTTLPEMLKLGDITEQGLPFYSGKISYKMRGFTGKQLEVKIPDFEGSCVKLVGDEDTLIAWPPYRADIKNLKEIQVVLTRRNTFGPLHQLPARAGAYGPDSFLTTGDQWSDAYVLLPQGLMKAPELFELI